MNILITGATKGIGRAIAEKFAKEGFELALCSRSEKDLRQLEKYLRDKYSAKVMWIPCDVSDKKQVKAFAGKVKKKWQRLNVLVNNAGIFQPGNVTDKKEAGLEHLMALNFFSAYFLTRELLSLMQPHRAGHIFNMCSVASLQAYSHGGLYSVSKHALLGFSRALREELKEYHIRVTSVFPGATYTPSWAGINLPESRFMDAKDVADLIFAIFSLSQRSVVEEVVLRPMLGDI
ncbi:MAG TPA: SDR family oxidoreductase [Chitinophagales bacterium]|nr:SDR family oxidoreductase [Chitinophagales bacterium]